MEAQGEAWVTGSMVMPYIVLKRGDEIKIMLNRIMLKPSFHGTFGAVLWPLLFPSVLIMLGDGNFEALVSTSINSLCSLVTEPN